MSLVSMIGPRPNLLGHQAGAHKRLEVAQPILTNVGPGEDPRDRRAGRRRVPHRDARRHLAGRRGRGGAGAGAGAALRGGHRPGAGRHQHPDPVRPRGGRRPHRHPGGARHRGRAPSPDPPGPAHADRPRDRDRRGARGAPLLRAGRLRRRGDQPLPRLRDAGAAARAEPLEAQRQGRPEELHQGARQGRAEGDVQDGHLHLPVLLRRADLRRRRPLVGLRREVLHRHRREDRGRRAWPRSPPRACAATPTPTAMRRSTGTCSTSAATTPCACAARSTPGRRTSVARLQHAVRGQLPDEYAAVRQRHQRAERAAADHPRPDAPEAGGRRRSRWTRSSRPPRSSSASPPAR